jgi:phosphopentomutase
VLLYGPSAQAGLDLGTRKTFADLGQTVAHIFGVGPLPHGTAIDLADHVVNS